jgi:hypothetical protein
MNWDVVILAAVCVLLSVTVTLLVLRVTLRGQFPSWVGFAAINVLIAFFIGGTALYLLLCKASPYGAYGLLLTLHQVMDTFHPRPLLNPYFKGRRIGEQVLFEGLPTLAGTLVAASLYGLLLPFIHNHTSLVAALFSVSLFVATIVHLLLAWGTLSRANNLREHFRLAGRLLIQRYALLGIGAVLGLSMPIVESLLPTVSQETVRVILMALLAFPVAIAFNLPDHWWQQKEEERLERRQGESMQMETPL